MPSNLSLLGVGGNDIPYLLRATFSQDMAAPLPASLPVEYPAGTTAAVADVEALMSISSGKMNVPVQASAVIGEEGYTIQTSFARSPGRAALTKIRFSTVGTAYALVVRNGAAVQAGGFSGVIHSFGAPAQLGNNGAGGVSNAYAFSTGVDYWLLILLRAAGAHFFIKGGTYAQWTRVWTENAGTTTPLYAGHSNFNAAYTVDEISVLDLNPALAEDYTSRLVSPIVGATFNHTADFWLDITGVFNAIAAASCDIYFRYQDASNYWMLRIDTANGSVGVIRLYELNAGVSTQRATWNAGLLNTGSSQRIQLRVAGNVYTIFRDTTINWTYTDPASFLATRTSGIINTLPANITLSELNTRPYQLASIGGIG